MILLTLLAACDHPSLNCGMVDGMVTSCRNLLDADGGRVDWCGDTIAFDRFIAEDPEDGSEVWTVSSDGTDEQCLTCSTPDLPGPVRGQPAWHPSCETLVIQVQGEHFEGLFYETPAWGIHDDLWLLAADGSWAEPLVTVDPGGASLHPQFSESGDRLFWAVRESTGETIFQLPFWRTPLDEDPWEGWHLAHAAFERPADGPAVLSDRQALFTDLGGFFESHAMTDEHIYYTHTPSGSEPFVDDGHRAAHDGSGIENLTSSPETWEEHLHPNPDGSLWAFNSSRSFDWDPTDGARKIKLEVWVMEPDGEPHRVTAYNDAADSRQRSVTSDFAWGPAGELLIYRAQFDGRQFLQSVDVVELAPVADWP